MNVVAVIAPESSNPVIVKMNADPNLNHLDEVIFSNGIQGTFEVREKILKNDSIKTYSLMPVPEV